MPKMPHKISLSLTPLPPEDQLASAAATLVSLRVHKAERVFLLATEEKLCTLLADIRRRAPADAMRLAEGMVAATVARAVADRSDSPTLMIVARIEPTILMCPIREMLARKRPARGGTGGTFKRFVGDHEFALHDAYQSFTYSVRRGFWGGLITCDDQPFCYVAMHDIYGSNIYFVHDTDSDCPVDAAAFEQAFGRPPPLGMFDLFLALAVPYFHHQALVHHLLRRVVYTDGTVLYRQRVRTDRMAAAIAALRADGYSEDAIVNSVFARDGWEAALQLLDSFSWVFNVPLEPAEVCKALAAGVDLPPHLRRIADSDHGPPGHGDDLLQ